MGQNLINHLQNANPDNAYTLPAEFYTDQTILALEQQFIFENPWLTTIMMMLPNGVNNVYPCNCKNTL